MITLVHSSVIHDCVIPTHIWRRTRRPLEWTLAPYMSGYDAIMDDRRMDEGNHVAGTANLLSDGLSSERTARVPTGQSQLSRLFEVNRDRVSGRSPDVIAGA